MNKQQYQKYLASRKWLLKKHKLISYYIKNNWHIRCIDCGATDYLQVDHLTYENVGKEKLEELQFLCKYCHEYKHFGDKNILPESQWKFIKRNLKRLKREPQDDWFWDDFNGSYLQYLEKLNLN